MLSDLINLDIIKMNLQGADSDEAIAELLEVMVNKNPAINRKEALEALYKRESQQSTAIDARVAIPHCICEGLDKIQLAIGLSPEGVEFDCPDLTKEGESKIRKPKLIFEILFTKDDTSAHLEVLKEIVGLISNNELIENIILAKNAQEVFNFIKEYDY